MQYWGNAFPGRYWGGTTRYWGTLSISVTYVDLTGTMATITGAYAVLSQSTAKFKVNASEIMPKIPSEITGQSRKFLEEVLEKLSGLNRKARQDLDNIQAQINKITTP